MIRNILMSVYFPTVAVTLALTICAVFIALRGFDWRLAYLSLLEGSFGNTNALSETFIKATPLIFTGLSFAIARRCGLVNLGAEGQLFIGGLFSTFVGVSFNELPPLIHLPLALLAGAAG